MCGRYAQGRAIPELLSRYTALGAELISSEQSLAPCLNIAPSMRPAVVFKEAGKTLLGALQWGFVPQWAKSLDTLKSKPINARSETADTSGMFRDSFRSRRCLVPATAFYEWQGSKPPKQPWRIHPTDQDVASFAGLWSRWRVAGGVELCTFAILTTEANDVVRPVHDRMPCILHADEEAEWLDAATKPERCKALLRPYPASDTDTQRVSTAINKPGAVVDELF